MKHSKRSGSRPHSRNSVISESDESKKISELKNQEESLDEELEKLKKEIEELESVPEDEENELTERKKQLEDENSEMNQRIEEIGDQKFLAQQYHGLRKMAADLYSQKGVFLDIRPLQRSGVLTQGESLASLPAKVQSMHKEMAELDEKMSSINSERVSLLRSVHADETEEEIQMREEKAERELQHRIDLMSPIKKAGKNARESQKESVKREIYTLKMQLDALKKAEEKRIEKNVSVEEVKETVANAGGCEDDVREVGDSTFMIGKSVFTVRKNGKSLIAVTNKKEQPLKSFVMDKYADPFNSVLN